MQTLLCAAPRAVPMHSRHTLRSYGCMPRIIDNFGKAAVYASAIKGNSCYVRGQTTMIATAGGAGLVNMYELICTLALRLQRCV
jgi:hypothetical protein